MDVRIEPYRGGRDADIARLIVDIQQREAGLTPSKGDLQDLRRIKVAYRDGGFWVARDGAAIVGCIGLNVLGVHGLLRRFFVDPDYRGPSRTAGRLYDEAVLRAARLSLEDLLLDTPRVATRAQGFYASRGFQPIGIEALPTGYSLPGHDSVFLRLGLRAA